MAAIYFLCAKEVETKKGDRVVCYILCKDGYGSPSVRDFWLDADSEMAANVLELVPGVAVLCQTAFGNDRKLTMIEENPADLPMLDLTAFLDTKV